MTQTQWNNPYFRKFRSMSAYVMYNIGGYSIELSQVEVFEHPRIAIDRVKSQNSEVKLYVNLIMKSGKELIIVETFPEMSNVVTYKNWFGKIKTKQIRFTNQEYFDYAMDNLDSDIGKWYAKLKQFRKDFANNICVVRH